MNRKLQKNKYMKHIKMIGLMLLIISGWTLSAQQTTEPLHALVQEAVKVSPKLNMLQQKLKAARENIQVGTHLADPVLSLGLLNVPTNTFSLNQEAMTGKVINLSQAIPYPGALKAKADVKAMDTLIIKEEISDLRNQIIWQVSTLYFSLQEKRREIVLAHESHNLLKQISLVAKRKFEVGTASLQNIISVEVALTRVNDKIETLKGEENALQAQLNALLLRNDKTEVATAALSPIPQSNLTTAKLLDEAEKSRPYLQGIRWFEQKTSLQQKEAKFAFYPNFKVGIQYSQRSFNRTTGINYPDFLGVVVGLNIPINYGGKKNSQD
jgi:cobalt-zinc-cadmium efflux system outer membrane protein